MTISRAHVSTHRGDAIYWEAVRWPVNCFTWFTRLRSMFNLILYTFQLVWEHWKLTMHTYWTSMLWSIDSCQNRVSADQYHLSVSRAQVRLKYSLKLSAGKLLVFKWSQAQVRFVLIHIHMKYGVFMCRTIKILISNWSVKGYWPYLIPFRSCISNGKRE